MFPAFLFNGTSVSSDEPYDPLKVPAKAEQKILDLMVMDKERDREILALTTAFWDVWLRGDEKTRVWLDGADPRSILEKEDRWLTK